MKLDMELVRRILFAVEDCPNRTGLFEVVIEDVERDVTDYHVDYCVQKGLLTGSPLRISDRWTHVSLNLSPDGHDFVEKARNDTTWGKAKAIIKEKGLPLTIEVFKSVLTSVIKSIM